MSFNTCVGGLVPYSEVFVTVWKKENLKGFMFVLVPYKTNVHYIVLKKKNDNDD